MARHRRNAARELTPEEQKELFLRGGDIEPSCRFCGELVTEALEICRKCWGDDL